MFQRSDSSLFAQHLCHHGIVRIRLVLLQIRRWDAQTMVITETHNSNKAVYCIAAAASSSTVVAFGGADRAWRLWDSRQSRKEDMVRP